MSGIWHVKNGENIEQSHICGLAHMDAFFVTGYRCIVTQSSDLECLRQCCRNTMWRCWGRRINRYCLVDGIQFRDSLFVFRKSS